MISIYNATEFCCEDISLIENYDKAIADTAHKWVCHHRDEVRVLPSGMIARRTMSELIENGRYYKCPANELIFLTVSEHNTLHHKNKSISAEARAKMSASRTHKTHSDFGRKFKEQFGITKADNVKLYMRECAYYHTHDHTCSWES